MYMISTHIQIKILSLVGAYFGLHLQKCVKICSELSEKSIAYKIEHNTGSAWK